MPPVRLSSVRDRLFLVVEIDIKIPLYRDKLTPEFLAEGSTEASDVEGDGAVSPPPSEPPAVHMDAMAFGMGCCCLQVTFQVNSQGGGAGGSAIRSCNERFSKASSRRCLTVALPL